MIDMNTLHELGTEVPVENPDGSDSAWYELEREARNHPDAIEIAAVRQQAYGIVLTLTAKLRRVHPVVGDAHAVLWHTDNNPDDISNWLRLIDKETAPDLISRSTSVLMTDVIRHYETNPSDDGNPAYRFYRTWTADRAARNAEAARAGG